jgi:hypothetical protein
MKYNKRDIEAASAILKTNRKDLDLLRAIKTKRFRLSELNINPRNAVHWEMKGVFLNKKTEGRWHLLDLSEATWILIVQKLREFNFKLELINDLKNNFLNQTVSNDVVGLKEEIKDVIRQMNEKNVDHVIDTKAFDEFLESMKETLFEVVLMDIIHLRNNYRILFNSNGGFVLVKDDFLDHPLQEHINEFMTKSHFSLSINEIVAELLGKMDLNLATNSYKMISIQEMEVLTILRSEGIESIEIQLDKNSNTIEFINYTETLPIDAYQRLSELIMRNGYQDITIKTHKGRISHCENKVKKKMKTPKKSDQL